MKRFKIEQSDADIISHSGLSLIGQAIKHHTNLSRQLDASIPLRHGIKHSDVIKSYLALLSIGKNDFEAINTIESEFYFMSAMDINDIPCEATLHQSFEILDKVAHQISDNVAAHQLQKARQKLFKTIHGRTLKTG